MFYTRAQLWRKVPPARNSRRRKIKSQIVSTFEDNNSLSTETNFDKNYNDSCQSGSLQDKFPVDRTEKQRVEFLNDVYIITIPNRLFYENEGMKKDIWYQREDFIEIKTTADKELNYFIVHYNVDVKTAKMILYQSLNYYCTNTFLF